MSGVFHVSGTHVTARARRTERFHALEFDANFPQISATFEQNDNRVHLSQTQPLPFLVSVPHPLKTGYKKTPNAI